MHKVIEQHTAYYYQRFGTGICHRRLIMAIAWDAATIFLLLFCLSTAFLPLGFMKMKPPESLHDVQKLTGVYGCFE
jgi:hypothetical protein